MANLWVSLLCIALVVVAICANPVERQRGSMTDERGQQIEDQARKNHGAVIQELKEKFKNYKENCFPMPKGCRCVEKGSKGEDIVKRIHVEAECRVPQSGRTGGS